VGEGVVGVPQDSNLLKEHWPSKNNFILVVALEPIRKRVPVEDAQLSRR
jgi:hypothetical protein